MNTWDTVVRILPEKLQQVFREIQPDMELLCEIRLRAGKPLLLQYGGKERCVIRKRPEELWQIQAMWKGKPEAEWAVYCVSEREVRDTLEAAGRYSLYAYEEELRQGFLTLRGGHRIGVAGRVIMESGQVRSMKQISFLNIRICHQVKGCGDPVMPYLYNAWGQVYHTLIISPPGCGKTTLLRDLIRQISDGNWGKYPGYTVGVVDERSELAGACDRGTANDVGIRTDVLDCCPKIEGMMLLVRSMSPEVVAVDEIGRPEEIGAIETVIHSGCRFLATVHGNSLEDIAEKPLLKRLVQERVFQRYLVLRKRDIHSSIMENQILDEEGRQICLW